MQHRLALCLLVVVSAFAAPANHLSPIEDNPDEITNLPGVDWILPFRQFSGYLDLPNSQKHLFYWLVMATSRPESAPVVLWTNGGPGCSGLIGFLTEQGPFRPMQNLSMEATDYPWNQNANMLFVEQPAGVGFSYSDNPSDYTTGDAQAASDNYQLILEFFKKYPELSSNPFYITSESYGGHYMPTLAKEIVVNDVNKTINFKGFAVGNPLTNMNENAHGMYDTFAGHAIVAKPTHDEWTTKCSSDDSSSACSSLEQQMLKQAGNLDPYAIDYPICNDQSRRAGRAERVWLLNHLHQHRDGLTKAALKLIPPSDYQPCEGNYATDYLNRPEVKAAIHAKADITWGECSNIVNYSQADVATDMVPVYKFLLDGNYNLKILVYSGDDDSVCGALGTVQWIWKLSEVTDSWKPWNYNDTEYGNQIGGYIVKFKGFSFATVHGAGHAVPSFRAHPGFELFSMFLDGRVF